jgi:two-component system chemotaxis response regulator CheB
LIPKIKALAARYRPMGRMQNSIQPAEGAIAGFKPTARPSALERGPVEVLAIGTSTGGPNALAEILPELPEDFRVPILIVQHMPPLFTAMLAERLHSKSALDVREAKHGDQIKPGQALIAPGDHHMVVRRAGGQDRIELTQDPPENSCRPSVDVLFRSVASTYGAGVLAVVLTGMGSDGLRGCERVHELGGAILAQDEASSVVWGMPGFVARAGLAERVLPLDEIATALVGRVRIQRTTGRIA